MNPFKELFRSGSAVEESEESDELLHREARLTPEEKEKRLAELREWKSNVEAGMKMEAHPDDAEQLDKIDEEIRKLEEAV